MIAKRIRTAKSYKGSSSRLINYLTNSQGKDNRVGLVTITNCESMDLVWASKEIEAVQNKNTRSKADKTYHLVLSFPAGERPSDDVLKEIESHVCSGIGYKEHQRISVQHDDTDNFHVHIAINKIHPKKITAIEPFYDHIKLGKLCEEIENKYELIKSNHAPVKDKKIDMEHQSGLVSLLSYVRNLDDLHKKITWSQFHDELHQNGIELQKKGNGFVFTGSGISVKASSVSSEFSKASLEKKLGEYEPPNLDKLTLENKYIKKPIENEILIENRSVFNSLYEEHQKMFNDSKVSFKEESNRIISNKNSKIEDIKKSYGVKRKVLRLLKPGIARNYLYKKLSKEMKKEIGEVFKNAQEERSKIKKSVSWLDFLKIKSLEGNELAVSYLRNKTKREFFYGNSVAGKGVVSKENNNRIIKEPAYVTKAGTLVYHEGKQVIRDKGDRLFLVDNANKIAIEKALDLAVLKFGPKLEIKGDEVFKKKVLSVVVKNKMSIVFSDNELEKKRLTMIEDRNNVGRYKRFTGIRRQNGGVIRRGYDSRGELLSATRLSGSKLRDGSGSKFRDGSNFGQFEYSQRSKIPPPFRRDGLQDVSELGVVFDGKKSEMLLQSNVSSSVGQHEEIGRNNDMRRGIIGSGGGIDKYIEERNIKHDMGIKDIKEHVLFERGDSLSKKYLYLGTRKKDEDHMILLTKELDDRVFVLPVSEYTLNRCKSTMQINDVLLITGEGKIKAQIPAKSKKL